MSRLFHIWKRSVDLFETSSNISLGKYVILASFVVLSLCYSFSFRLTQCKGNSDSTYISNWTTPLLLTLTRTFSTLLLATKYIETDTLLFIDQVAADFFGQYYRIIKNKNVLWDFLVSTVQLHLFLSLHKYISTRN